MKPHWPKVQQWQRDDSMQEQSSLLWSLISGLLGNPAQESKYESLLGNSLPVEEIVTSPKSLLANDRLAPRPKEKPITDSINTQVDGLARLLISEADGESLAGKQAVANVVMNRVNTNKYGFKNTDDVLKSISKPGEFESYNNKAYKNASKSKNWNDAVKIATAAYQGRLKDITGGSLYFRNPTIRDAKRKEGQDWFDRRISKGVLVPYSTIGNHEFYRQTK